MVVKISMPSVVLLLVAASTGAFARVEPTTPPAYAAAQARRGGDALRPIRAIHLQIVLRRMGVPIYGAGGGGLTSADSDMARTANTASVQVWLEPPRRFVESVGRAIGIDGQRVIGPGPADSVPARRRRLIHLSLVWLLVDPAQFPLDLTDRGTTALQDVGDKTIDGHTLDVVEASGPDDFHSMLYFDQQHRLVLSQERGIAVHGSTSGRGSGFADAVRHAVTLREAYSDFKRVQGVELPFTVRQSVDGQLIRISNVVHVDVNPADFEKPFK